MLIGLNKTLDEFEDQGSGLSLRALKTLTSKQLVNNYLRVKVLISKFGMLMSSRPQMSSKIRVPGPL